MQAVSVVGPSPISWLRLPRKFIINFLATGAIFLVSGGTILAVLYFTLYSELAVDFSFNPFNIIDVVGSFKRTSKSVLRA